MPRAATSWVSECLESHSDVIAFGETGFWGKHYLDSVEAYAPHDAQALLKRLYHLRSAQLERLQVEMREIIDVIRSIIQKESLSLRPKELFDWIAASVALAGGKPRVLEKTPHHINWIDRIASCYPDARFIVMEREPYGFMLSYKHQGDRKNLRVRKAFNRLYHPAGCALMYRRYVRAIAYAKEKYPDRVRIVSHSQVREDPKRLLEELQCFLGLERIEDIVIPKTNTSFPDSERPELAEVDVWWMNLISGRYVRKVGGALREARPPLSEVIRSVARLPLWAWHVVNHLKKDRLASVPAYIKNLLS